MRLRNAALPLLALCLFVTTGCGSLKRAGTDVAVTVTSPLNIPLSAAYDSLDWGEHTNDAATVLLFPFNFVLHGLKHASYTAVHIGDLALAPLYVPASIKSDNDLEPLDMYSLSHGFPWKNAPVPGMEDVVAGN